MVNIAIHILTNIAKNKGNKTMKFGQLIEFEGAISGRRQFLATVSPLKTIKNAF